MKVFFHSILIIFTFCFSSGLSIAQEVTYSPYEKFDYRNGNYSVVGQCGDKLYTFITTTDGAMLIAYNDSMNSKANIYLDFFPVKLYNYQFICYPDKMIVLYQGLESNKVVQYAAMLDDKGRLISKPVELGSVKTGIFGAMKNYFYTLVSEDKKTIVVYSQKEKSQSFEMECKWINDSLKVVKRGKASFETDREAHSGDLLLDNNGTIYMEAYTVDGNMNYADQYWMLSLPMGENKFRYKELILDDKYIANSHIKMDNINHTIYVSGFYSNERNGHHDGILYTAYNTTDNTFTIKGFHPITTDMQQFTSSRRNHYFDNFVPKQVIPKNDGGFVLITESQFITTRSNYVPSFGYYSSLYTFSPYSTSSIREYHFDDIFVFSFNKDGHTDWYTIIPKNQYSQEDGGLFSSYVLLNSGGTLGFLFNDFNSRQSKINLATVDGTGKSVTNSFTTEGNAQIDWIPKAGKQVASKVLVVPCLYKKQICFAKVVF